MISLFEYINPSNSFIVNESGAAGHMAHPQDYNDYSCEDLISMVKDLFSARVTGIQEKLDGTNIQATMNEDGEVRFIRNKTDLNSMTGGMSVEDMASKWAGNPKVRDNYVHAGEIITQVFEKIGKRWFNPDAQTRRVVNCECISAGVTNIVPYIKDQVDFHNIWIYKRTNIGWEMKFITKDGLDALKKACEGIDSAQITPSVVVRVTDKSKQLIKDYVTRLLEIFGGSRRKTIGEWRLKEFTSYMNLHYPWIDDVAVFFNRWFLDDKSVNLRALKSRFRGHEDEVDSLCKDGYKKIILTINKPLDRFFIDLGNDIISLCSGLENSSDSDIKAAVSTLKNEVKSAIAEIRAGDSDEAKVRLANNLEKIGGEDFVINPSEGIVFSYKGKMQKLTGSFGVMNAILNDKMKYSLK